MHKAPVNRILPFSLVDGPGCRCAVFLQGCNIRCLYCHNPETQNLCNGCGLCVEGCPSRALSMRTESGGGVRVRWNRDACMSCDRCTNLCPSRSSPRIQMMDAGQVYKTVRESVPFIRGITVSGGECMLYPEFLKELFTLCRRDGLTGLIDSNGTIPFDREMLELCGGVMLDVKAWDPGKYAALTGGENDMVIANLRCLAEAGKLEEIRIVCLPGYVDAAKAIRGISSAVDPDLLKKICLKLIRFRPNGVRGELSGKNTTEVPYMERLKRIAELEGFGEIQIL